MASRSPVMGRHYSGSGESWESAPSPTKSHNSVIDTCICPDLYILAQKAVTSAGCKLCRVVQEGVQSVGLMP